jgi:hypothetical protein
MRTFLIVSAAAVASAAAVPAPAAAQWHPRGYGSYGINPDAAVNRCVRSVHRRGARVMDITQVRPRGMHMRVRGIASGGNRYYRQHLGFTCDVDRRGRVGNISFNRW